MALNRYYTTAMTAAERPTVPVNQSPEDEKADIAFKEAIECITGRDWDDGSDTPPLAPSTTNSNHQDNADYGAKLKPAAEEGLSIMEENTVGKIQEAKIHRR